MVGGEIESVSGQEAIEIISDTWREFRAGDPPIEQVNVVLGEEGGHPADWDDGVVTVAEEMNKGRYGTSSLENRLFEQMDEAFENTIESEIEAQRDILEERFSFLDDFGLHYEGVQVADLDDAGAHHGREVSKWNQVNNGRDHIVVDYSYFPWIDPLEDTVEGPAERVVRHEAVHALQSELDRGFSDVWRRTGSRDIERATTEGMARYEQYKGTDEDRRAEQVVQNPEEIADFWRDEVLDEDLEASDPYSYGEVAAYFLEEAHRQRKLDEMAQQDPTPAAHIPTLNEYAEKQTRKTMLDNPEKEDLNSALEEAGQHMDVPFYGEMVAQEYEEMQAYLEGEAEFTEKLASPEGEPGLVKVLEEEDAARRALESASFVLNNHEYDTEDYLRAEARVLAAERLDFQPEEYEHLKQSLETTKTSEYNKQVAA